MLRTFLLLAFLALACNQELSTNASPISPTPPPVRASNGFQKGIALGMYYEHSSRPYEVMLDEIAALGADHVEFVLHWTQADIRSTEIARHPNDTISDKRLMEAIAYANKKGLRVLLFPIIDVAQRKIGEWRGTIKPPSWDDWWKSYQNYIFHYADLAEKSGVAILSVGSELVSTEEMCDRWDPIIAEVRKRFKGKLTYSANWDHYKQVCFWNKLDFAGMTAYYILSKTKDPSYDTLLSNWKNIKQEITTWQKTISIPLVITEVGYPSQDGCSMTPWDYTTSNPVDLNEQFLCYRSFRETWQDEESLGGVYFWNWYDAGGPADKTYSPRGKPAEAVIRQWYQNFPSSQLGLTQ